MRRALGWFLERTGMAAGVLGLCLVALAMIVRRQRAPVRRVELDGVTERPEAPVRTIEDIPHPLILRPAPEWWPVLHATHSLTEIAKPWVRA